MYSRKPVWGWKDTRMAYQPWRDQEAYGRREITGVRSDCAFGRLYVCMRALHADTS